MDLGHFFELFVTQHLSGLTNSRQIERRLRGALAPWMDRDMAELRHADVLAWYHGLRGEPARANSCVSYLKTLYNKARAWGHYEGGNPCDGVRKVRLPSRRRYLLPLEVNRLRYVLSQQRPSVQTYFTLLLCTGSRRNEAATIRWADLTLEGNVGIWIKPQTKNGESHTVPIVEPVLSLLRSLPRTHAYVFVTRCGNPWPGSKIERLWSIIRAEAQIHDVRLHDLRRTTASWLAENGVSLPVISEVLGHKDYQTTKLYIRGMENGQAVRQALQNMSQQFFGGTLGKEG